METQTLEAEKSTLQQDIEALPRIAEESGALAAAAAKEAAEPVPVRVPALPQVKQPDFMSIIEKAMLMPDFQLEKLERLLEMQKQVMAKQAEMNFNAALVRLSGDLPRIKRTRSVAYDKVKGNPAAGKQEAFKYAAYEDIDAALRPLLAREGLHPLFTTAPRTGDGGGAVVTCTLLHIDGHSMSASVQVSLDSSGGKNNIQAMSSTISYGKRISLSMLLNIVTEGEDDDGEKSEISFIGSEQAKALEALIKETNSDRAKFLAYVAAESVEKILPENLEKGMKILNERKAGVKGAQIKTHSETKPKEKKTNENAQRNDKQPGMASGAASEADSQPIQQDHNGGEGGAVKAGD